jgi:ATP/maltotriose-dependent transcriptional regulator MalT
VAGRIADADRARDAVRRESWAEAYEELRTLDPAGMEPRDLENLADAAWWLSRSDESIAARQRAYAGYVAAGEDPRAAWCAGRLCIEHSLRGEPALAAGWLMRTQRLLRGQPERVQHGYLAMVESNLARARGETDEALARAERATELGLRFGDPDLAAMGIHLHGLALIDAGRVAEGMALLGEAMTAVVAGELGTFFTGVVYCNAIAACLEVGDVGRLGEWNDAARQWCESLPPEAPFPAICRVNRAEAASLRGAWPEAEAEASRASRELRFSPRAAARAFYETGEIRRRVGNLAGAEEAFARAHELGLQPQPGLALLRLAQGRPDAALRALRVAVADKPEGRPRRARLLAALVEIALAAGDLDAARQASRELDQVAGRFGTPALDAAAATAGGALRLAEGDLPGALDRLRTACATWQELRLPYETARARLLYGAALRHAGSEEDALLELRAALAAFERLGAAGDAAEAAALLGGREELPRGLTAREAEVLRLVAAGKTNREVAAALVISEHTVARHVQNIFVKLGVSSRSAATAFAFEHKLT